MKRLGHVQIQALHLLQESRNGLTAPDLRALGSRSVVSDALYRLAARGLVRAAGTAPNAHPRGMGMPRKVYAITEQGRRRLAEVTR